ncbi:Hypothetical protein CINCED_3A007659 [Cinara cedri]|nr:Hypothetical protein CINCED_3A007659 [Cinara cedri]
MTSDNDDEPVSSSGSVRPSPVPGTCRSGVPATTVAKGILVHCNNKKSANTNRVSFDVTSSSSASSSSTASTPSSTPSPPVYRARKNGDRSRQQTPDDGQRAPLPLPSKQPPDFLSPATHRPPPPPPPSYSARDSRQITGFGIKSYLHEFYDDPAEDHFQSLQDDDFKYHVEPEIRWHGHCSGVYAVLGLTAVAIGAAMMAVGHLIPAKKTVVGQSADAEVVDRWAVSFNENLALCRCVGSAVFAVGVVFTVVRFWISVIRSHGDDDELPLVTEKKLADAAADDGRKSSRLPLSIELQRELHTVRIPITGSVENVQPEPGAIRLQFGDIS